MNSQPLKNYTSSVPIERTIFRIESLLAQAGAKHILKDYAQGRLMALAFHMDLPTGRTVAIRLPANAEAVYEVMREQMRRPRPDTLKRLAEQADRTAWKVVQDWLEVQLTLIRLNRADFLQVFLAYVWDGKQTFYDALKANKYLALPEATTPSTS